jgi:queuosine precursor transporter
MFENLRTKSFPYYPATLSYIGLIVLLNSIFSYVPELHMFGQQLSFADFVVGLIYVSRDFTQREIKHWVILAMLIGCAISFCLAEEQAAIASLGAFAAGEFIDWGIFTYTQKPLSQRILWSSLISAPIDSYVNLYLLKQFNWTGMIVMCVVKAIGVLALWYVWRLRNRQQVSFA